MFVGDFPAPIEPAEQANLAIEFTSDVPPSGLVVSTIIVSWTVVETDPAATADANPSSRLVGNPVLGIFRDPAIGPRTVVLQTVHGCIDGNRYRIEALMALPDGQVFARYGHIWCRAPV